MDVLVDRNPAFWASIASDPAVAERISLGRPFNITPLVVHPLVTPLRSENGGFVFVRLDAPGRIFELHTLYRQCAWGTREIPLAAKRAFEQIFATGAQLIVTQEVAGNSRSRPPKTFRFAASGDFAPSPYGPQFRTWYLTQDAWASAPARRT